MRAKNKVLLEASGFPRTCRRRHRLEVVNRSSGATAGLRRRWSSAHEGCGMGSRAAAGRSSACTWSRHPALRNEKDGRLRAFQSFGMSAAGIAGRRYRPGRHALRGSGPDDCHHRPGTCRLSSTSDWEKQFIPIAGEPTNHEPSGVSPSERPASRRWHGLIPHHCRSEGVQARIPKSVHDNGGGPAACDMDRVFKQLPPYLRAFRPGRSTHFRRANDPEPASGTLTPASRTSQGSALTPGTSRRKRQRESTSWSPQSGTSAACGSPKYDISLRGQATSGASQRALGSGPSTTIPGVAHRAPT